MFLPPESKNFFDKEIPESPFAVLQTGSGMGTDALPGKKAEIIPYGNIPGFPVCRVEGHRGRMLLFEKGGLPVVVFQGRFHLYEGYKPAEVVTPVSAANYLETDYLFLLNAAGGIDEELQPGEIMFIDDHINLTGADPLRSIPAGERDPAFPDPAGIYSPEIYKKALKVSTESVNLKKGVLACMRGPCYETPAEVNFLKTIGADAVSMSVVMEALAAACFDIEMGAFSIITNKAAQKTKHKEVIEAAGKRSPEILEMIFNTIPEL